MDLTDPASVDKGFAEAQALLGHIDILINNAGQGELGSVEDTDLADSRALFEVNYFSVVRLVEARHPRNCASAAPASSSTSAQSSTICSSPSRPNTAPANPP